MNALRPWQRIMYFLGEAAMVGGLIWAIVYKFTVGGCPAGPFNFITLVVAGLTISTIPLHPFGERAYFTPHLRRMAGAAIAWWLVALAGLGCSLYLLATMVAPVGYWWFFAAVPAMLFFWFAVPSKLTDSPVTPARAPQPPKHTPPSGQPEGEAEQNNEIIDSTTTPEQGERGDA